MSIHVIHTHVVNCVIFEVSIENEDIFIDVSPLLFLNSALVCKGILVFFYYLIQKYKYNLFSFLIISIKYI